jgi:hypothetical protein
MRAKPARLTTNAVIETIKLNFAVRRLSAAKAVVSLV